VSKALTLVGHEVQFTAPDQDVYLDTLGMSGPVDVQPVLETYALPGGTVLDVGANIGVTAVMSGFLVGDGRVVAMEPVPETFRHLQLNTERSGLTNVTCLRAAAGSEEGEVELVTQTGANVAAFVGYEHVLERYRGYEAHAAPVVPLDQVAADQHLDRVDFIKVDVEGYELEVLRGARTVLADHRPVVFLEANHYCLNIFRRMSLVDFTEEVLSIFPLVYALDTSCTYLDLTDPSSHPIFFHDNAVLGRFPNLLCGFGPSVSVGVAQMADRAYR
jgi:FkbM family methyltransferase